VDRGSIGIISKTSWPVSTLACKGYVEMNADQSFAAVGTGIIDFKTIFQHKNQAG